MVFRDSRKLALAWSRLPQGGGGDCSLLESCKSIQDALQRILAAGSAQGFFRAEPGAGLLRLGGGCVAGVEFLALGVPEGWQSVQLTRWMLWRLAGERNVVSILVTSNPQCENFGWHWTQDARASLECDAWQARQLKPS